MNTNQIDPSPIVLCHGLFGSLSDPYLIEAFGTCRVFAPDLLGYGENASYVPNQLSLTDQADHVIAFMDDNSIQRANLLGHSVGGAVAALIAIRQPERVRSLISVEGNMTPADAFWSANLSKQPIAEIQTLIDGYRSNVARWISDAGVAATSETVRIATDWLNHQPASTLKAQARAVVEATSDDSGYIERLRSRLVDGLDLHLIAGENSRSSWHVPGDIEEAARSVTLMHGAGHLMMLESPSDFAEAVLNAVTQS